MTLIDRLRAYAAKYGPLDPEHAMCVEASDEIERLRAARQDGWRPISSAPKGEWIVGYVSWGQQVGKFHEHSGPCEWVRDHHEFVDVDFDVFPGPTHWLPYRKDRPADVLGPEQGSRET